MLRSAVLCLAVIFASTTGRHELARWLAIAYMGSLLWSGCGHMLLHRLQPARTWIRHLLVGPMGWPFSD